MARRSGRAPAAWQTGTCLGHHATALVRETQRDSCYADCAWVSPAPTAPGHQSPCACPCGRSPARLARRSEPGSSPAPDLRQRADHDLHDRSIARSNDPHPHATAELNLNRFRGRSRAWLRDNRHRREPRRGTLSASELLPPSEMPAARATSEATAPGSSAAATIRSFSEIAHRRRRCTDVITSTCVLLIGLSLGLVL